jgi:hypothetical protein
MNRFYNLLDRLQIPRKRAFLHIFAAIITGGFWTIFAVAIELFLASERGNKVVMNDAYFNKLKSDLLAEISLKQETLMQMEEFKTKVNATIESDFAVPFELTDVTLWESREKITTVTTGTSTGKTRAGTVGLGWGEGIGLAATQGVTRETFTSGTTEMMKNEFMELDSGTLRITKEFTAFIGDQFTRTAKYPDVLSVNNTYVFSLGFNILNSERAWLVRFQGEYETNIASEMLNLANAYSKGQKPTDLAKLNTEFDAEIAAITGEIRKLVIELEEIGNQPVTEK